MACVLAFPVSGAIAFDVSLAYRHSRYDGSGFQHGGSFRMQPREQFDTGVDAGRNDAALKRAEPGAGGAFARPHGAQPGGRAP